MITRRIILCISILGVFATACSAIVAAELSDTNDFRIDDDASASSTSSSSGSTSSSGSSGVVTDPCSLLYVQFTTSQNQPQPNDCSNCIQNSCQPELAYACDAGASWLRQIQECAQNPSDNGNGNGNWACAQYDPDASPVTGESDTAYKFRAGDCIHSNCIHNSATPPCKTCPVTVQESEGNDTQHALDSNPCGHCVATNCAAQLVRCCNSSVVGNHVQFCGFIDSADYKTKCNNLNLPDGGPEFIDDKQCDSDVRACFQAANCASQCQ